MSVVGIGTDIVDIDRIRQFSDKRRQQLAKRVLTVREQQVFAQKGEHADAYLAKRWAAKEAVSKALGTGIAKGVSFQHIEISASELGQPIVTLTEQAKARADALQVGRVNLSLSDEQRYAVAFVVLSQ